MIEKLKKILFGEQENNISHPETQKDEDKKHKLEVATCALFIELAKADGNFTNEERDFIISTMKECFKLNESEVEAMIELAEQKVEKSISIYEFTTELNELLNQSEKESVIKNLWRLIFMDKKLNTYEDSLIKKIASTLNLEHKTIIELKLQVKKELNIE